MVTSLWAGSPVAAARGASENGFYVDYVLDPSSTAFPSGLVLMYSVVTLGAGRIMEALSRRSLGVAVLLLVALPVNSGCIALTRQISEERVQTIRRIAVVPFESPPLEVVPEALSLFGSPGPAGSLVLAPDPGVAMAARGLVVAHGLLMLMALPEASKEAAKVAESIESLLFKDTSWVPGVVLAQEIGKRLRAGGHYEVVVVEEVYAIPGIENRERTFWMMNWWVPTRQWYNEDPSAYQYRRLVDEGIDAIVEVAIANYAVTGSGKLFGYVLIKLVDPVSGKVLARGREWDVSRPLRTPFQNNAEELKASIAALLGELAEKTLRDMRLLRSP